MSTIKNALSYASKILEQASPTPKLDAEVILLYTLKKSRTFLYTHPESTLTIEQQNRYKELINKRQTGYPVAYIIGHREFWSLPLTINESTLIPRPESELLVELTLSLIKVENANILELGTGSGAISLALGSEKPKWKISACDISNNALNTARLNARQLNINNINFFQSDWFSAVVEQQFDAIISNPPYIAKNDPHLLQGDVKFEPKSALESGENGLDAIKHIIKESIRYLAPGGLILLEHGYDQRLPINDLLKQYNFINTSCWQDYQSIDRVSGGIRANL